MKVIKLPTYEIEITLEGGGGSIKSGLNSDNQAMGAIESVILAHAVAGVDVEDPGYIEGIETALNAIFNRM